MLSYPTGNDFVALSHLSAENAALYACNLISSAHRGLLQLVGDQGKSVPFLNPQIFYKKKRVSLAKLHWEKERHWIPVGTVTSGDLAVKIRYVAPPRHKGFAIVIDFASASEGQVDASDITCSLAGSWGLLERHINVSEPVPGGRSARQSMRRNGLLLEFSGAPLAFSVTCSSKDFVASWAGKDSVPETLAGISKLGVMGKSYVAEEGEPLNFCLAAPAKASSQGVQMAFYVGFGLDEMSAVGAGIYLDRLGPAEISDQTAARLDQITMQAADLVVQEAVNRNAMFCHFYSMGRTYDREDFVCMASRHTDSVAAYWDRDALLWSFPCVLQQDRVLACELLEYAFTTQLRNCGNRSRFIDGTSMEPGMELDQLCAPVIELVHYLRFSNDFEFARKPFVQNAIAELRHRVMGLKIRNAFLFRTFLSSTDDVAPYSVLTYMNVLAWRFFFDLAYIDEKVNAAGARSTENRNCALRLRREIYTHCIRNIEGKDVFVYAIPTDGETVHHDPLHPDCDTQDLKVNGIYDDPLGSLVTLPYWGFCKYYDPVYEETVRLLMSKKNKLAHSGARYDFAGAYQEKKVSGPFVASIANQLLVRINQQKVRDMLEEMPLDNGLACTTIDPKTGEAQSGQGIASMAGFWAYAMYRGLAKVASFGLPPATPDEIARTEGAIRQAALEAGQPYPRPHVPSSEDSGTPPRKVLPRTPSAEGSSRGSGGIARPAVRPPSTSSIYRVAHTPPEDIPDDIGNRLPNASRSGGSRFAVPDEDSDLSR